MYFCNTCHCMLVSKFKSATFCNNHSNQAQLGCNKAEVDLLALSANSHLNFQQPCLCQLDPITKTLLQFQTQCCGILLSGHGSITRVQTIGIQNPNDLSVAKSKQNPVLESIPASTNPACGSRTLNSI